MLRYLLLAAFTACSIANEDERVSDHNTNPGSDFVTVELATVGVDTQTGTPVVLLRDTESGEVVPILVGIAEAEAIARSLHEVEMPRPMTHDLFASLLTELNGRLEEVRVHDVREGIFYGSLHVRVGEEEGLREIDSRPSDAMALALRTGAAIRIARRILLERPDVEFGAPDEQRQVVRSMGVSVISASPRIRDEFDLPDRPGVLVSAVASAAAEQGLQRGDFILEVGGREVDSPMDFLAAARGAAGTESVEVLYWRDGSEHTTELSPEAPEQRRDPQRRTVTT